MERNDMSAIGINQTRIDARAKVRGEALYPGDFNLPNSLHMKVKFSDHAHAIVKAIDITEAMQVPGIELILTAADVPNNEYGLSYYDQPVLCGLGSNKPFADRVRFIGDQVALVVAESIEAAEKALDLIHVEYEELPVITEVHAAIKPD